MNKLIIHTACCLLLGILSSSSVWSQDIESIVKTEAFKMSGDLRLGGNVYQSSRPLDRRSPFSYYIQGRTTFSIYGFSMPVVLSFRDSKFNYSQSVNRIGLNPKYKWVQLMLGSNSYQFSPYTLSGQNINGIGVKLTPGKFHFTAMRGTMRNLLPQIDSLVYGKELLPVYQRKALGVKLGFDSSVADIEFMAFKAKDELDDTLPIQDTLMDIITPSENIVIGLKAASTIAKVFSAGINMGGSVITDDQTNEPVSIEEPYQELVQSTLVPTSSTRLSFAGDVFGKLDLKGFSLGLKIKQVQPFYKSLGLFYIQEDYRNMTINTSFSLLDRKLLFSGSFGKQRNNLKEWRARTNERNISSVQMNYNSGSKFGLSVNFSNYAQDQSPGLVALNDTLRYAQVSKTISINPRLTFMNESNIQNIVLSLNQYNLNDLSTYYDIPKSTNSRILNLQYNIRWKESGLGVKFASNYNRNTSIGISSKRFGGTLGLRKKFEKKVTVSISSTYNLSRTEGISTGSVVNSRFSLRISPKKKQRFSLNLGHILRTFSSKTNINDLRANTAYTVSF